MNRLPWPPAAGGSLRDWQNVVALAQRTELSVVALNGGAVPRPPDVPMALWTSLDTESLREPKPFDGSERILEREWWRNELGYPTDYDWSPFRAATLRRILDRHAFDFAVIEDVVYWRYAEIVRRYCLVLIDYHNVQSRLDEEHLDALPKRCTGGRKRAALAMSTMRQIEESYIGLPAIVCSQKEKAELIARGFSAESIAIVHNTVSSEDEGEASPELCAALQPHPSRILFSGMMDYPPNAYAALDLVRYIFPRVRAEIRDAELWIVGMNPEPDLLRAAGKTSNVYVTGAVAHTKPYFRASSVLSVPLTLGGGTRFKIVEALKYGLPVVSSPKGCEGLNVSDGRHLLIARTPAEHASQILAVLRNADLASSLADEGEQLYRDQYSFATAVRQWDDCLARFGITSSV